MYKGYIEELADVAGSEVVHFPERNPHSRACRKLV